MTFLDRRMPLERMSGRAYVYASMRRVERRRHRAHGMIFGRCSVRYGVAIRVS
jgi:hypothetical protein